MKMRNSFVSNSSSSSFIICGNNVYEVVKNNINNNELVEYESDYFTPVSVGEISEEMIRQFDASTREMVEHSAYCMFHESVQSYFDKIYWTKIADSRCNCFDFRGNSEANFYDVYCENGDFSLCDDVKRKIEDKVFDIYKKTNSKKHFDYYINIDDYKDIIEEQVNNFIDRLYKQNKEVYVVSFGDNHGECSGDIGAIVEYYYLGEKAINCFLKSDFIVYRDNEH